MEKKLPNSIEICPIVDAIVEIRFKPKVPANAIFGILYTSLRTKFKKVENLPILQIPEPIRKSDPNLKYKPLYKISNDEFVVQIGLDVITIGVYPKYLGWNKFSKTILEILETVEKLKIISEVERFGIRYINFFKSNIFENLDLKISLSSLDFESQKSVIRTTVPQGKYLSTLQISNDAKLNNAVVGSIIDIDCSKPRGLKDFFKNKKEILEGVHLNEKKLFFQLISEDFLKKLKPKY